MVTVTDREIPARQCTKTALPSSLASSKEDKRSWLIKLCSYKQTKQRSEVRYIGSTYCPQK